MKEAEEESLAADRGRSAASSSRGEGAASAGSNRQQRPVTRQAVTKLNPLELLNLKEMQTTIEKREFSTKINHFYLKFFLTTGNLKLIRGEGGN